MIARILALSGLIALIAWQWMWHAMIAPPLSVSPTLYAAFFCLPMVPFLLLMACRHRAAMLFGALAALLFYFPHGVMEAMVDPQVRTLALCEVAISVLAIFAASWNGLRARFARKPAV